MAHRIKKGLLGKSHVLYECPHCRAELDSELEDAGQTYKCPTCFQPLVVPGKDDLHRLRAGEEQRRQKHDAEEQRRHEQNAESAAALQAAAIQQKQREEREAREQLQAANRRGQEEERHERDRLRKADEMTVADRLLAFAFKFAKGVSVLVIIGCFGAVVACGIALIVINPQTPQMAVQPLKTPSFAEYQNQQQSTADATAEQQASTGSPADALTAHFENILRRFGLEPAEQEPSFIEMDSDSRQALVTGLEQFIASGKAAPGAGANAGAVKWFIERMRLSWEEVKASRDELERQEARAIDEANERRRQMLIVICAAVATLLSFLFLPLMIQIEQNTRRVLELQAASQKGVNLK